MEHLSQHDLDPQSSPESQPDPTLVKQQKAYEKKLKQYEKEKARWEYFQANKERILKNNKYIEAINKSGKELYDGLEVRSGKEASSKTKKYGLISSVSGIMAVMEGIINQDGDAYLSTRKFYLEERRVGLQKLENGDLKSLETAILGLKLYRSDKTFGFIPKYFGSYIYHIRDDEGLNQPIAMSIFTTIPLPKKPTPPEVPKAKVPTQTELTELKKEVLTSKEMNRSKKTSGDMISTTYEVVSNGKTIRLDKETHDLYLQFKATRKERPHDLDLSFDHFKATYLDKHPKFMRK